MARNKLLRGISYDVTIQYDRDEESGALKMNRVRSELNILAKYT